MPDLRRRLAATKRTIYFAAVIIIILLSLVGVLISRIGRAAPDLASFSFIDANGSRISLYDNSSEFSYVQFLPKYEKARVDLFIEIVKAWKNYSLRFLLITQEDIPLSEDIKDRSIVIVRRFVRDETFSLGNPHLAQNYLLNGLGKVLYRGNTNNNYTAEMKMVLNQIVAKRYFDLALFIPPGKRIQEIQWLKGVSDEANQDGYTVVSFFTSLCSSCMSGDIVNIIKNVSLTTGPKAKYLAVFYDYGSRGENINLLKSQLGLDGLIDVVLADASLRSKWQDLIDDFSVGELSNIVLIIKNDGTIVAAYYRNCTDCWSNLMTALAGL